MHISVIFLYPIISVMVTSVIRNMLMQALESSLHYSLCIMPTHCFPMNIYYNEIRLGSIAQVDYINQADVG